MKAMTIGETGGPMSSLETQTPSQAKLWTGRIVSGLPLLFLAWDGAMKLVAIDQVVAATAELGFARNTLPWLAAIELLGVLLTCLSRTRVVGAVLLSAYLGGAVATHVRLENPLFSHTLFPIYVAALLWGGLYLRDARVRALSPFGH
jgi:DoxX-like family